jgi:hypothetical protein
MEVLTKKKKALVKQTFPTTLFEETSYSSMNEKPNVAMTKGWQCCKCKETMYDDEMNCTWDRCNHRRCKNCRSFTN